MRVALLKGGLSQEAEVSRATAKAFAKALDELSYSYLEIEADQEMIPKLQEYKPDVALIALHGKYAEDGVVQSICEFLKIPYTGSGILASALAMDKLRTKEVLSFYGVKSARFQVIRWTDEALVPPNEIGYPCVVKPSREGSSVGVSILKTAENYEEAVREASKYDRCILVEEFISGPECTVSVVQGRALTPIEIRPKQGFYDYKNKYTKGNTEYLLPPELSESVIETLKERALKVFQILDLHHYARIDFMVQDKLEPVFIEANTLPGCTETSLLPNAARYDGIEFKDLIQGMIENARLDYKEVL